MMLRGLPIVALLVAVAADLAYAKIPLAPQANPAAAARQEEVAPPDADADAGAAGTGETAPAANDPEPVAPPARIADDAHARQDGWVRLSNLLADVCIEATSAFGRLYEKGYDHAPALMLGLLGLLVLPPLALVGGVLQRIAGRSQTPADREGARIREPAPAWPAAEAWLEFCGPRAPRFAIGHGMLRIGRDEDADIRLAVSSVQRAHALVHRTPDAEIVITDLSGQDGNGVVVNRKRLREARLRPGDLIELGEAKFKFGARPA